MAIAASRRRAYRNKDGIRLGDGRSKVGGEIKTAGSYVGSHYGIEARFENRDFAAAQGRDFLGVLVHAGDLMAEIGEAGAGHEPHIPRANHGNSHEKLSFVSTKGTNALFGLKAQASQPNITRTGERKMSQAPLQNYLKC